MRPFTCGVCASRLLFENSRCVTCGTLQGFDVAQMALVPVPPERNAVLCANLPAIGCVWLVDVPGELCVSCRLTRTRPADDDPEAVRAWARTEADKRRLVYQLLDLGLPVDPEDLRFDLLSSSDESVVIGHADGVVTLDLAEEHDPHRERMREQMGEAYRTMLGHLRHETGHYYQQVLVDGPGVDPTLKQRYVDLFGDDSADYAAALERHYQQGAPVDWGERFVSEYATAHPFEDWAETFAHYLHITDTLQTAAAYGLSVSEPVAERVAPLGAPPPPVDHPVEAESAHELVDRWLPLSFALNAVNRSMGTDDLYPFVLTEPVIAKLEFVHELVQPAGRTARVRL